MYKDDPRSSPGAHDATAHASNAGPTIMVAEDDEDNRLMLKLMLQMKGYGVIEARNGYEAVETARRERPNLILMDLSLPLLDGLSATTRIRENRELSDLLIVVVSGHSAADFRDIAIDAGCNEYIMKPIDFDHMDHLLERLLSTSPKAA